MARGRSSDIRRELRKVIPVSLVNELARETGAVQRQRRVRIYDQVWGLVLGFAIGRKRTLAALRRRYERTTGQTIEESSFYKLFSPGLARIASPLAKSDPSLLGKSEPDVEQVLGVTWTRAV